MSFGPNSDRSAPGVVAGFVGYVVVFFTVGIILFMPDWDKNNQNLWDKVSSSWMTRTTHG